MENISIKILDNLFDLCEGENFVILDKEDIIAPFPDHDFATDELTEILESLTVEGFIDLKYADNNEYCIAMRTKGRTFIKQSREKIQRIVRESAVTGEDDQVAAEEDTISSMNSSFSDDPSIMPPPSYLSSTPHTERRKRTSSVLSEENVSLADGHFSDSGKLSRGYTLSERDEDNEKSAKRRERRTFLAALIGAAAGSLLMDLIFLVIVLIKLKG